MAGKHALASRRPGACSSDSGCSGCCVRVPSRPHEALYNAAGKPAAIQASALRDSSACCVCAYCIVVRLLPITIRTMTYTPVPCVLRSRLGLPEHEEIQPYVQAQACCLETPIVIAVDQIQTPAHHKPRHCFSSSCFGQPEDLVLPLVPSRYALSSACFSPCQ